MTSYFNTDKIWDHGYFPEYTRIAAELGPESRICELGVWDGESLKMWQSLFPLGEVTGIDHNAGANWPPGTRCVVSGQDNPALPGILGGKFDLIVDDASHDGPKTRKSFDLLWPLVKPGGYYVIEDWAVAFTENAGWDKSMLTLAQDLLPLLLGKKDGECDSMLYRWGLIIIHRRARA